MSLRSRLSGVLGVLAGLALVLALAAGYVHDVAAGPGQFADRATSALQAPAVRALVARRVTDDLVIRHGSRLLAARPLIQGAVAAAIGGRAFGELFRAGVRDLHRAAVSGDQNTVTLTVADAGTLAASGLDLVRPALARQLRVQDRVNLFRDRVAQAGAVLVRVSARARLTTIALGVISLLAAVGSLLLAADRRRALSGLGVAVAVAGLLLIVGWQIGSVLVAHAVAAGEDRAAAEAVYRAFLGDLRLEGWVVAGLGAVLAAAAVSVVRPAGVEAQLRRLARLLLGEPRRAWARAARGAALVGLGALCLLAGSVAVTLLLTALGIALIYRGAASLLGLGHELLAPRRAEAVPPAGPAPAAVSLSSARIPARRTALAVVAVAVCLGAAIGGLVGSDALQASGPAPAPCDGSPRLCDRTLPGVALAATHNAMSAPLPGWYGAEQEVGIPGQLQAGIRGLLIDTHEAERLPDGHLRTVLGGPYAGGPLQDVPAQTRRAAERLRDRIGFRGSGPRGLYLCHGFCELGGTPLATVLGQIDDYLVAHPQQVLVIINEDYVAPRAFVRAVDASGLGALAYRGPTSGRWPTLAQMIASGGRVLFLAEHHAGAAPWYHLGYQRILEETPYAFSRASQLTDPDRLAQSCRPGRGPRSGAPLLLVNNWVSTDPVPLASNAAKVNATAPLLRRLRACEKRRDHVANLVAVNFFRTGGLMQAVDALNGVPSSDTP